MSLMVKARLQSVLLVMACFVGLGQLTVDSSFGECTRFLYKQQPPTGVQNKEFRSICQRYNNQPRYATLYDTVKRIPFYSAYTFKRSDGEKHMNFHWMYEPQLSSLSATGNMVPFLQVEPELKIDEAQAVLEDYADTTMYERGQLNPDEHQATPDDKAATYTLTNVVPQVKDFYRKLWSHYLNSVRRRLNNYCHGTAYVVTGVITTGSTIRKENIDRLAIPKYIWSAYCCPDFDPNAPYEIRYKFPSFAAYGLNDIASNFIMEVSQKRVEALIKQHMPVDQNFQLFASNCIL
ncbi:endonuclease domain-containing 1 protein-like [Arapaima gigas]